MRKAQLNIGGTLLKIVISTGILLVLGMVAFLSREIKPDSHMVSKTLDSSKFEETE